jgi:signal transduction histidine kinase/CheY-like chemotaxis protein
MTKSATRRPRKTAENSAGRRDFWQVYSAHWQELNQLAKTDSAASPVFGPDLRTLPPDAREQEDAAAMTRTQAALLDDDWQAHEKELGRLGDNFAAMGVSIGAIHEAVRKLQQQLTRLLVLHFPTDPERLIAALAAKDDFLDRGVVAIASAYVPHKERSIREHTALAAKRAEELREQAELLHSVLDALDDEVLVYKPDGNLALLNRAARKLFPPNLPLDKLGSSQESTLSYHTDGATLILPEERPSARALRGEVVNDFEFLLRQAGTDERFMLANARPLRAENGDVRGAVVALRDVTARKRLGAMRDRSLELTEQYRRAQEVSRLKSEFLANMSHELRTPLNAILGFGELLHNGEVPPESPEFKEFLGDIVMSGRHLLQLINDILDLAKVEAGKLIFHPEPVDIQVMVQQATQILRGKAADKRIPLSVVVEPDIGAVVADPARLMQVLYNYLSNALKFTPDGGHVEVRVKREGPDAFRIEVEDDGIGIAEKDVGELFVEFRQLDAGATRQYGGTGLGLALTRRLVEAQGGSVGVRSEVGKGSTFHAVLPCKALVGNPLPEMREIAGEDASSPWALVVEDDEKDMEVLVRTLAAAGWSVRTASTKVQALESTAERKFDAITLDLLLPDGNGLDVLAAIRSRGPNQETPVVVVSVVQDLGGVTAYTIDGWLPKPIEPDALLTALQKALSSQKLSGDVLVVDDDLTSCRLMEVALARLGYRAVCRQTAKAALEDAKKGNLEAVVLDLMMPDVDGFEFLARFKQLPLYGHIPVLVWTSKDLTAEDYAYLSNATQGVLAKGNGAMLTEELQRLLAHRDGHAELHTHR